MCSIAWVKTVGERIRQAREALGWTGDDLAKRAGYRHQSAISNLEARATGQGGRRLDKIATALGVHESWLRYGPDSAVVPFVAQPAATAVAAREESATYSLRARRRSSSKDPWIQEAIALLSSLSDADRRAAILCLRAFAHNLGPPRDGQALSVAA